MTEPPELETPECPCCGEKGYHDPRECMFCEDQHHDHATGTCRHCGRSVVNVDGRWIDPQATGDDSVWRETCDAHDTVVAEHEPDAEDEMRKMIDALDLPPADPNVSVQLLNELQLSSRFNKVTQQLLELGEVMEPKTQKGRDLHSERAAYVVEMSRRGMR